MILLAPPYDFRQKSLDSPLDFPFGFCWLPHMDFPTHVREMSGKVLRISLYLAGYPLGISTDFLAFPPGFPLDFALRFSTEALGSPPGFPLRSLLATPHGFSNTCPGNVPENPCRFPAIYLGMSTARQKSSKKVVRVELGGSIGTRAKEQENPRRHHLRPSRLLGRCRLERVNQEEANEKVSARKIPK